jgi:hypothetical protein
MDCTTPPQRIVENSVLGYPFLFDPRAKADFSGKAASLTMWVDGFKPPYRGLESVDLTHKFYDVEDRENVDAPEKHVIKVVLRDAAGRKVTHTCSFMLHF